MKTSEISVVTARRTQIVSVTTEIAEVIAGRSLFESIGKTLQSL
jgi:hypothetical protein